MTATVDSAFAHDPSASDVYDPDDVLPQNSPLMKAHRPKLEPSPSPPALPIPKVSLSSSSGRISSNRRQKVRPSLGDAVLIHYLDGGKRPEIVAEAWSRPLAHYDEDDEDDGQSKGDTEETVDESGDEDDTRSHEMSPGPAHRRAFRAAESSVSKSIDLQFLATNALAAAKAASKPVDTDDSQIADDDSRVAQRATPAPSFRTNGARDDIAMKDANRPVLQAPISPYASQGPQEMYSPRNYTPSQVLMHPNNVRSPPGLNTPTDRGELPPIQEVSPKSDSTNHDPLPSIRAQLLDQFTGPPKELAMRSGPQYPHSPPGGPPRMGGIPGSHASPPISPNDAYRPGMPSPAHTLPAMSPFFYPGGNNTNHHRSGQDYSSGSNADTPGGSGGDTSTPATSITERMSIDNMTNPAVGAFVCTVQGCTAPPFQTQYLLNSHANVHSSARPHYCSVKGCPRSEGGKGFKRKNEMIRHGLVHDSPGYVCPFCPDREHKYPRPDNLQRHVRVHHVDKDKDDPALRDVLSQRPDGPNRGRRRRGGP
ncbi:hypothetical protein F4815DRAFT_491904 [Daldinia loculata]|uniref:uncharacterized protein n=1 Tax=Daldinia loculata TaxID=103429 RepID=UPI0020C3899F|nr:uncharacterized protein F4817DRAFT_314796 [Daldinia loculata]KAI1648507.1 hypothetical protein F4817DRAFT_314796 [Daldinia loculata]KAI2782903.1 hypothetical protein F4815DRAFT_491904 [Daldinia loculata]